MRIINIVMYRGVDEMLSLKSMHNVIGRRGDHNEARIVLSAHESSLDTSDLMIELWLEGRNTRDKQTGLFMHILSLENDWSIDVGRDLTEWDEVMIHIVTRDGDMKATSNGVVMRVEPAVQQKQQFDIKLVEKLVRDAIVDVRYNREFDRWDFVNINGEVRAFINLSADQGHIRGRLLNS